MKTYTSVSLLNVKKVMILIFDHDRYPKTHASSAPLLWPELIFILISNTAMFLFVILYDL